MVGEDSKMSIVSEQKFNEELGFRLMQIRQEHKMSLQQLGAHIGVQYQQVQKYERGTSRISPMRLALCARIFEVGVEYFYGTDTEITDSGYSKAVLGIASEVADLPTLELKRSVFHLAKEINKYASDDEEEEIDIDKLKMRA